MNIRLTKHVLGKGSFGKVYLSTSISDGVTIMLAVKTEEKNGRDILREEYKILKYVNSKATASTSYVLKILGFWEDEKKLYLALPLMGPSLGTLRKQSPFSLKTILMISDMTIEQLRVYHALGIIHRDIKPDNYLVSYELPHEHICLTDFGLARHAQSTSDSAQRVGSLRYMSKYGHSFTELGRRDDMYSLGYTLLYLHQGSLPWSIEGIPKEQHHAHVRQEKTSISNSLLTRSTCCASCQEGACSIHRAFIAYFDYLDSRSAHDEIDYDYLIRGFLTALEDHGWIYDKHWDWLSIYS